MIEWIRRIRNSWGYEVQSPNDYNFVRHVLREETPYYAYESIHRMVRQQKEEGVPCLSESTCKLLFRLTNHVHPDVAVEVGAGLSVCAMAMAHPTGRCVAITASDKCYEDLRGWSSEIPQLEIRKGDELGVFAQLIHESGRIDLLHIAHTICYKEIVETALPYVTDKTLFVIENIRSDKQKHEWWNTLREGPDTGMSYDLGATGLLFFDRSRHKDTYWINIKD